MKAKLLVVLLVGVVSLSQAARADVLWDQSVLDYAGPGIANSDSPGWGGFTIHGVNDVTVDGCGWIVTDITQYYSSWNYDWITAVTQGYLHVFPKTGALPVEDPSLSAVVPMTAFSVSGDVIGITASGLGINLPAGEYWIGITPMGPAGLMGANLQFPTAVIGDEVASYDMMLPGWTNMYVGYDGSILVEGTPAGPSAADRATWGGIKTLYR